MDTVYSREDLLTMRQTSVQYSIAWFLDNPIYTRICGTKRKGKKLQKLVQKLSNNTKQVRKSAV